MTKNQTFRNYFLSLDGDTKERLAAKANTSIGYLYQITSGHRKPGADLISRLMEADNNITFQMMRSTKS